MRDTGLDLPGICVDSLQAWLSAAGNPIGEPTKVWLLSGGRSNMMYGIDTTDGHRYCLRRPPLGDHQATHDVSREFRILDALQTTTVPVPRTVALCDDASVIGSPFFIMEYVPGVVCDRPSAATDLPLEVRQDIAPRLAAALASVHDVDVEDVGLGELSRRGDYVLRQVRTYSRLLQDEDRQRYPLYTQVAQQLREAAPPETRTSLVHGDFKLGNCILGDDGSVRAVLDWELSTLGDPTADAGWLLASWSMPNDGHVRISDPPTTAPGFPRRSDLVSAIESTTNADLADLAFFVAFAQWKWACIDAGIHRRFSSNEMGPSDLSIARIEGEIDSRLTHAHELLSGTVGPTD